MMQHVFNQLEKGLSKKTSAGRVLYGFCGQGRDGSAYEDVRTF